jgi:predicted DNA-binding protein (UPF0251 family)
MKRIDYSDPFSKQNYVRFWSKVKLTANPDVCWDWIRCLGKDGYGMFQINGRAIRAHRFSYLITNKKLPDGKLVCHTCDNPKCVNPNHLFLGSALDNVSDCIAKKRRTPLKGDKSGRSKLKEDEVLSIFKTYNEGHVTQDELAQKYNVSSKTISKIITRTRWKHLSLIGQENISNNNGRD